MYLVSNHALLFLNQNSKNKIKKKKHTNIYQITNTIINIKFIIITPTTSTTKIHI